MKTFTRSAAALALLALGCEQEQQSLPFQLESEEPVTRTVSANQETVVSSPSGATLTLPPNSLPSGTQVTMTPQPTATSVGAPAGAPVIGGTVFGLSPTGTTLSEPASVDIRYPQQTLSPTQELGLIGVNNTGTEIAFMRRATVDLTSRVVSAKIETLGTVGALIAPDVLTPQAGTAAPPTGGPIASLVGAGAFGSAPVTYRASCSIVGATLCTGSSGVVTVHVSQNIADRYASRMAMVGTTAEAELTFDPQTSTVTGSISYESVLRARLGGSVTGTLVFDNLVTGPGSSAQPTPYVIQGAQIIIDGQTYGFTVANNTLTLILPPEEIELENNDGTTTTGTISASLVLQRQ